MYLFAVAVKTLDAGNTYEIPAPVHGFTARESRGNISSP